MAVTAKWIDRIAVVSALAIFLFWCAAIRYALAWLPMPTVIGVGLILFILMTIAGAALILPLWLWAHRKAPHS
jgi:glucan phosphoethanolaminetransferase (alkaline phosphatase superfamily)